MMQTICTCKGLGFGKNVQKVYSNLLLLRCTIHLHCEVDLMKNLLRISFNHTDDSRLSFYDLLLRLLLYNHHFLLLSHSNSSIISNSWTIWNLLVTQIYFLTYP